MSEIDRRIADKLITYGIDLARYQKGVREKIILVIREMEGELVALLIRANVDSASAAAAERLIQRAKDVIAEGYTEMAALSAEQVSGLVGVEAAVAYQALKETRERLKRPKDVDELADRLLVFGGPMDDWWTEQGSKVQFAFGNAVRQGRANGETIAQIVDRIRGNEQAAGLTETARSSATKLARDIVATASNQARLEVFRQNSDVITGYMQVSTLDGRTSDICMAYSGATWDANYEPSGGNTLPFNGGCPRHPNCRSTIVPITGEIEGTESFRTSQRASMDGPVRVNMTFEEWLSDKSEAFQNEKLGPGKAQLWRDGKITLRDLVDQNGRRGLSLEELKAMYG